MTAPPWVVAVRAAVPGPRPQGWQAFQQAVGLAEAGLGPIRLVCDAALLDGVPCDPADWLGRPLPAALSLGQPFRPHRPPSAGLLFRRSLAKCRDPGAILLCRDPRVAAAEARRPPRRRFGRVVLEWHGRPDPRRPEHRAAFQRADLNIAVAPGLTDDLLACGVEPARVELVANACGLDPARAAARAADCNPRDRPVLALGLHRRGGLDLALSAWTLDPTLPPLWIAGQDQGSVRVAAWRERVQAEPTLRGRVRLLGPAWGAAREELLDRAGMLLALYPLDMETESRLCPLQVVDAAGSGLPLVATDLASVRCALAGRSPAAILIPAGEPLTLAAGVRRAMREGADMARSQGPEGPQRVPRWADRARQLARLSAPPTPPAP
jgi:hypothetical protein